MSVNSYLYLYQFVYLQDKSLLNLVQSYAILTSVQLVIEWFFHQRVSSDRNLLSEYGCHGCLEKTMEKTHCNSDCKCGSIGCMGKRKPFNNGRFKESFNQPCKMPFTWEEASKIDKGHLPPPPPSLKLYLGSQLTYHSELKILENTLSITTILLKYNSHSCENCLPVKVARTTVWRHDIFIGQAFLSCSDTIT